MKRLILIGDSHIQGLYAAWTELVRLQESNFEVEFIEYSGISAYSVDFSNINPEQIEDHIIFLCFGENDIRRRLPKHDNAKEVVQRYIDKAKFHFKDNRIIFLQPVPQAIDHLTDEFKKKNKAMEGFIPYTLEERLAQQNNFYAALEESGEEVIKMIDCLGVNFTTEKELEDGCHLNREHWLESVRYINHKIVNKVVN